MAIGKRADTKANGNGHAPDYLAIAAKTLRGDLRDLALRRIKTLPKPFAKLSEQEQRDLISGLEFEVEQWIRTALRVIAAEGRPTIGGTMGDIKVGKSLELKVTTSRYADGRHDLFDAQGSEVLIILADAGKFMGQRKAAKATPDAPELPIGVEEREPAGAEA